MLDAGICTRALGARDARFDGLFFVGITSTGVYCRPVCPARVSYPDRRRFFESPAAAESAGFRPCLRCRPELAPGRSLVDAVPRLAHVAAHRIAAGALNEKSIRQFAEELGVSERHLRRALEREVGVSPLELAQTHRLLLAKRLLVDTSLSVTRVAYASGFQSLRRFNSVFRERYRMSPTALRRGHSNDSASATPSMQDEPTRPLSLTLAYREPLAWDALLGVLRRNVLPGVEVIEPKAYGRTIRLGSRTGVVFVRDDARRARRQAPPSLTAEVSPSLVPALMPLLARLRHLFDLDAEPTVIDSHLAQSGLGSLVGSLPGLRIPGAFDGFEAALALLVRSALEPDAALTLLRRLVTTLGEPLVTGNAHLTHIAPTPQSITDAGVSRLAALGAPLAIAAVIVQVAHMVVAGELRLEPGSDVDATQRALLSIDGVTGSVATAIVGRALQWPDAFRTSDPTLRRVVGASSMRDLAERAGRWRPWRAYAAMHLQLSATVPSGLPE
jgi:AraC family transcriptional regulator, regulatory protein of adaptative response / DNA-3-methyladenine glycosylase II